MPETTFQERYDEVERRIAEACDRAGRARSEVELVAVSKTHNPEAIREAADCGLLVFGESKVQEARAKIGQCPGHLTWHLIGHLQTNKVRHAVQLFDTIHSLDSVRLLEKVDGACAEAGRSVRAYIEVNVSGEASKHGLAPGDLQEMLEASGGCGRVEIVGLMTIPPWAEDPGKTRNYFAQLRDLYDQCNGEWGFPLGGLSMGMTHDFEVAIEEGATCVRVGTALFGTRGGK